MSKPLSEAQSQILNLLGPFDGARIPGGCERCDAYQQVIPAGRGVWVLGTFHDEWCPAPENPQNRTNRAKRRHNGRG